jgi:uncharacterized protein YkuJ
MNDDSEQRNFGRQGYEVKEIHFFGITQTSNTIRVLIVQRDKKLN